MRNTSRPSSPRTSTLNPFSILNHFRLFNTFTLNPFKFRHMSTSTLNRFRPFATKSSSDRARVPPLTAMIVYLMRYACSANSTTKTVCPLHSAKSLQSPPSDFSCAAYVWRRCRMIRSLVLILVDILSVENVCADTLPRALVNVDSLYCAPLVLQIKARERE
jgi:hypothetical protein